MKHPTYRQADLHLCNLLLGVRLWLFILVLPFTSACNKIDPHREPPLKNPYTPEERQKIDLRLFNELNVYNRGWKGKSFERRYNLIKGMADEGYELAELTLRLFDFRLQDWDMPFDRKAWKRLRILAEQGDASAQCLAAYAGIKWKRLTRKKAEQYKILAANQNHPGCFRIHVTIPYRAKQYDEAKLMQQKAARLGNHAMQLLLISDYAQGDTSFPLDLGKAYCWYKIAQRPEFDTGESVTYRPRLWMWTRAAQKKGIRTYTTYAPDNWCEQPLETKPIATLLEVNHG